MKVALLVLLAVVACSKMNDVPVSEKPAAALAPAGKAEPSRAEVAKPEASVLAWKALPTNGPLAPALASFAKDASAAGRKPYAYLHADWCGPCKALEATHATDAQMIDAFAGTAIAAIDIDAADGKELAALGLESSAIPVLFKLDAAGKPTGDRITGGAWDDNIPANMAPPLKAFFAK